LLAKLNAAANARAAGNGAVANNTYQAFIDELNANQETALTPRRRPS
jgi:hypothetical protein